MLLTDLMERTQARNGKIVVFDAGGVLVRINRTWQDAADAAGVPASHLAAAPVSIFDFDQLRRYETNEIGFEEYLRLLGEYLGCSVTQAREAHNHILGELYPGIADVVDHLLANAVETGLLSNTSDSHWAELTGTVRFAPLGRLKYPMGSFQVQFHKPDAAIYQAYERQFGLAAGDLIFFDDKAENVEAAIAVGWAGHVINPFTNPAEQIERALVADGVW